MVKKRQPVTEEKPSSPELVWVVREGKECFDAGIQYLPGDIFPFDDLPLALQNLHLPNLERVERVVSTDDAILPGSSLGGEIPPGPPLEGGRPEEIVEIITQQEADPIYPGMDEDGGL